MTGWLQLTNEQRKISTDQAALLSGIQAKAIEKDWWVTLTLEALFKMPVAKDMVFKGGTSLSKCWKLIQRFSEDVDIALSPEAFSMKYEANPGSGYLSRLKKKGCEFTSVQLKMALQKQFAEMGIPEGTVIVEAAVVNEAMPDTDPQTLLVKYISLYDDNPYLMDEVKIEVSVRSLNEPHKNMPVHSLLHEIYPNTAYDESPFTVTAMEPQKTFLEKTFLLHEEFMKPAAGKIVRTDRMSRHLYDIEKIMDTHFGWMALENQQLYDTIVNHRERYSRYNWLDYSTLGKQTLSFLPPVMMYEEYKKDYGDMKEHMIYGDTLVYDDVIERLQVLTERFRK
ncbi:MAG: nucleotidyl transferase AbiEii/AbiGii toxin family protein [Bacteroidota bacterium]